MSIDNEEKINHHGKRADAIVKGMLQHSNSGAQKESQPTLTNLQMNICDWLIMDCEERTESFNVTMKTDFDESIGNINIIPQDIGRVI